VRDALKQVTSVNIYTLLSFLPELIISFRLLIKIHTDTKTDTKHIKINHIGPNYNYEV